LRAVWVKSKTLSQKYPTHKRRACGVPQMIECLPSKPEALSSNSSTVKKKERNKRQERKKRKEEKKQYQKREERVRRKKHGDGTH
jgi:hypothetical protein